MEDAGKKSETPERLFKYFKECLEREEQRKDLARLGQLEQLRGLYGDEMPHLPGMNSPLKWDFYSFRDFESIDKTTGKRIQAVIDQVPQQAKVLDYGCGYGYVLGRAMAENKGWAYTGIDFSEKFIRKLKANYPEAQFFMKSIAEVENNHFDAFLLLEVLEHIPTNETLNFLPTLKPKLRDTGKLIVSVPLHEELFTNTCPCWSCGKLGNPNGHVRSYTPELIAAELMLSGFTIEKSIEIFPKNRKVVTLKNKMKKLLGREMTKPCNLVVVAS